MSKLLVTYKRVFSLYSFPVYELVDLTPCCSQMGEAVEEDAIAFGEKDSFMNTSLTLNFFRCLPYPEGAVWDEYPISFCPFCGEVVEIKETAL